MSSILGAPEQEDRATQGCDPSVDSDAGMAGAVLTAPNLDSDSGPTAVNPGVSGAVPLNEEATFLRTCESFAKMEKVFAWRDTKPSGTLAKRVISRPARLEAVENWRFCASLITSHLLISLQAFLKFGRWAISKSRMQPIPVVNHFQKLADAG
jgi:hypothetical protein